MRYLSTFSGIEAASVAWEPLGWEPMAFAEVGEFPSAVLAHRWPDVPNLGDVCKVDWRKFVEDSGRPDVLVGGSPCQSFSVAGGKDSLDGESRLMFEYIRACDEVRSPWVVWENVPGALHTKDNAFGQLIEELQRIGYVSLAWRVLDAQFFGVAQRRRRVFLVGHLGEGGSAAAVLFEPEGLCWDTKTSREKREELAARARGGPEAEGDVYVIQGGGVRSNGGQNGCGIGTDVSYTLNCQDVHAVGYEVTCMTSGQANAEIDGNLCGTLSRRQYKDPPIVIDRAAYNQGENAAFASHIGEADVMDPLVAVGPHAVGYGLHESRYVVRRITPVETERLQGFPDGHTDLSGCDVDAVTDAVAASIGYDEKQTAALRRKVARWAIETPDGQRYKATGNSFAVPVVRWIGRRIEMVQGMIDGGVRHGE